MKWTNGAPFSEQVSELTRVFSQWNDCEQTVVIFALVRRIPAIQKKFIIHAVQGLLSTTTELEAKEQNANNPSYIKALSNETTDTAISQLLTHLPLLRPGNTECKESYIVALTEIINHCVATGQHTEQTQQLLSYTLIHPAMSNHDRHTLTRWLRTLEDRISSTPVTGFEDYPNTPPRWEGLSWQRNFKQLNEQTNLFNTQPSTMFNMQPYSIMFNKRNRSNSLTPPVMPLHHLEIVERNSNNLNTLSRQKTRSYSVSSDHSSNIIGLSQLSPQSSCASSRSESRLDDTSNRSLESGMKDVQSWLKTLRLHKYNYLFVNMSYEDMLQLTEDQLAEQGVTKGARHKLALSIVKLQQRYNTLVNLEKGLMSIHEGMQNASFSSVLINTVEELKTILSTPMKPSQENNPQDIPTQFTKVVGKLCGTLTLVENTEDAVSSGCINILEKILQHDCFNQSQKEKVEQWRSRLGNPRPTPKWQHNYNTYNSRRYGNSQQHSRKPSLNHIHHTQAHNNQYMMTSHRNSISTPYLQNNQNQNINNLSTNNLRTLHTTEKRSSLQETSLQQLQKTLQRTHSAPRDHFLRHTLNGTNETTEPEINSRLESLCLEMTEQAIGGCGEV